MSQHEDFAESLAGYALDALDATERGVFEAHFATCAQCQTELVELRRVGAALGAAVEPIAPPPALKARVLAAATSQPQAPLAPRADAPAPFRRRNQAVVAMPLPGQPTRPELIVRKTSILPMAASVLIAAGLGWYAWQLRGDVLSLRREVGQLSARAESLRTELISVRRDAARLSHTASVLSAPVLLKADLKGDPKLMPNATGRAFISPERGLVFNAARLSPLSSGQLYQLWVIPPGAAPVAAGVIQLDASGTNGTASGPLPAGVTSVQAVAVSIETTPNPQQPSTSVVLLGTPVASSR